MTIRKASAEEMLALWGYRDISRASPTCRFFFRNISSGSAEFWTLEDGGELIGELYVFFDIPFDRDFADGEGKVYLCAFRVRREFRGQGLGTRLMKTVLADLKERGFRRATIGVSEESNERLYRRLGFNEKIKDCFIDPCAMDADMKPERDEGFILLSKDL